MASAIDWIALWHIYRPTLFQIYLVIIVPTMLLCSRLIVAKRTTLAGIVLSIASFVVVMWFPIGALLWIVVEATLFGVDAKYSSEWNGFAFAPLMALFGALAGAAMVRVVLREHVGKKEFAVLYAGNLLATALTITVLLILYRVFPPQVVA